MAREFAPALREAQRTIQMEKRWGSWPQFFKGLALSGLGEYRDAVRAFGKAFEVSGRQNFVALSALGHAYGNAGMHDHARDVLQRLQEMSTWRMTSVSTRCDRALSSSVWQRASACRLFVQKG